MSNRDKQLRDYAAALIQEAATEVEFLTVMECADDNGLGDLSEDEARQVHDLITRRAVVHVSWKGANA